MNILECHAANAWLDDGQPYLMIDSDPSLVLEAAGHAHDVVSN